jgi:hypothetical protein
MGWGHAFHILRLKRELGRSLAKRKRARVARSEAAHRGISAHWKALSKQTRALFAEGS